MLMYRQYGRITCNVVDRVGIDDDETLIYRWTQRSTQAVVDQRFQNIYEINSVVLGHAGNYECAVILDRTVVGRANFNITVAGK